MIDPSTLAGRRVDAVVVGWHVFEDERSQQQLFLHLDDGAEIEAYAHGSGGLVLRRRPTPDDFSMDQYGRYEFRDIEADDPAAVLLGQTIDSVERIICWNDTVVGLRLTTANGTVVLVNDYDDLFVSGGELPASFRSLDLTPRLLRRITHDYPSSAEHVVAWLQQVESGSQDRERVVAAVVLAAAGDEVELRRQIALSHLDWRDVLMNGGLANTDWPQQLDQRLQ